MAFEGGEEEGVFHNFYENEMALCAYETRSYENETLALRNGLAPYETRSYEKEGFCFKVCINRGFSCNVTQIAEITQMIVVL